MIVRTERLRQLKNRLARIDRQLKALDAEIADVAGADEELSRRIDVLTSIAGVGQVVATGLVADVPELGRIDGKAAASLVGVAPWTRESGQWQRRAAECVADTSRPRQSQRIPKQAHLVVGGYRAGEHDDLDYVRRQPRNGARNRRGRGWRPGRWYAVLMRSPRAM